MVLVQYVTLNCKFSLAKLGWSNVTIKEKQNEKRVFD